jgi:trans-aconitate 2-methyltransferase
MLRARPVAEPSLYYDVLAPHVSRLDIWETEYLHVLEGANPVVEWTRGSALKPLLDALEEPDRSGFQGEYASRIARAYPPRPDGRTLFTFRRLFIIAVR